MPRLILLAGLHKTGTTSIQRACRANLHALEAAGYWYPMFAVEGVTDPFPENHSRFIGTMFKSRLRAYAQQPGVENQRKQRARADFLRMSRKRAGKDLIIAAEQVSTLPPGDLAAVRQFFEKAGYVVEISCCVRRPMPWLDSMVAQRVWGMRGPRITIRQAVAEFTAAGSIVSGRIRNLQQAFPQARFVAFDAVVSHAMGPPGWFFEMLGVPPPAAAAKANERASDHDVRLASAVNEELFVKTGTSSYFTQSRQPLERIPSFADSGEALEKFHLRRDEAEPLIPLLQKDNDWLRDALGPGFHDERMEFSADPPKLGARHREFMLAKLPGLDEPVRGVIEKYVADH